MFNACVCITQVAIYLDWVGHYPTVRMQKNLFRLSHNRIILAREKVRIAILCTIYKHYVRFPTSIPDLSEDPKRRYFQGVYGCIDGSHLPIEVGTSQKENYRNRKGMKDLYAIPFLLSSIILKFCYLGFVSTNGLLICGVDNELCFQYASFGAEGAGSDSTILRYACTQDLRFVQDGYLLGDAGYALSFKVLTPYRGVRYHLKEFHHSSLGRPRNKEELFNLR